jgi:hypothetical protein
MAWVDDDDDEFTRPNVYAYLRTAEENIHARRGGRRILMATENDGRTTKVVQSPSPTLEALRAGEPVVIPAWRVPDWARGDISVAKHVRVHPDGDLEVVEP